MADTYLPASLPDLILWYGNFNTKIGGYGAALGLVAADLTAVANDYAMLQYVINAAVAFTDEAKERVQYRDTIVGGLKAGQVAPAVPTAPTIAPPATVPAPGITPRIRALVRRIKASPNYTDTMGKDLGIVAPIPVNPVNPKPKIAAEAKPASQVVLKYVKAGMGGVYIEGQRGAETTWTQIGVSTVSPYTDTRAPLAVGVPEVRKYRARYFKKDVAMGETSDVATVTTVP